MDNELVKTVCIDDFEMDYITFGTGPETFVIIPGMSVRPVTASASAIASGFRKFTDRFTVYVFDRRKKLPEGATVEFMASDVIKVMDKLGLTGTYMMGNSQGGMISMSIALKRPELIKKLVLSASASRPNPVSLEVMQIWYQLSRSGDVVALNRDCYQRFFTKKYLDHYAGAMTILEKLGEPEDLERYAILSQATMKFDVYDRLPEIKAELFVIGAGLDNVLSVEASKEIAEKTGCKSYIYEDYCHAVSDEAKDFRDRVLEFFQS